MSEEKTVPTLQKPINKKRCSWKQMFRKKMHEDQLKKEKLKQLGDEIIRTEQFLQQTWMLLGQIFYQRQIVQKLK